MSDSLPASVRLRLKEVYARFGRAWRAAESGGVEPRIADYLGDEAGPARRALLRALLRLDLDRRRRRGESPGPEDYAGLGPDDAAAVGDLLADLPTVSRPGVPSPHHGAEGGATRRPRAAVETGDDPGRTVREDSPPPSDSAEPPAVPGYEILGELGRGGMGIVYKARQTKLKRLVALKMVLTGDRAAPEELERFRHEVEAVARLRHPNIVQVYEVGEHQGRPFYSLELVEGGSLLGRLRESLPEPREAAALVEQLARAMHAAHQCRVVHRDLKPANVLLTADGTPKVTDFGLAKKLDDPAGPTRTGAVIGTPAYMAPEQAAGRTKEIGPAADVYALGAILYECLTGRPPFRAATAWETVRLVLGEEPVPPGRLQPHLPRDLETVCLKCLRKDPARRYADAAALADDLRRFLQGEPVRARPVGRWVRLGKWVRRRPATAALLAVTGLALLLLAGLVGGGYRQALREREQERQTSYAQRVSLAYGEWRSNAVPEARKLLDACPEDLRGWEWHYVRRLCHSERLVLRGHERTVLSVAFRPDGGEVAAAADDGTVLVWDATTGREVRRLQGGGEDAPSAANVRVVGGWSGAGRLAYSPDGRTLALACGGVLEDGIVKVWDTTTGEELLTMRGHGDAITGLAFSPDGQYLATSGADRTVRVWRAATGEVVRRFDGHSDIVTAVAFSPDGLQVASADRTGVILLWGKESGQVTRALRGHTESVQSLSFHPDGRRLATAANDGAVRVWDTTTGQALQVCRGRAPRVCAVAFSPDGRWLASGGTSYMQGGPLGDYAELNLWDSALGREVFAFRGDADGINGVAFGGDGRHLAAACGDGTVKLWDAEAGQDVRLFAPARITSVDALAVGPDGRLIACTSSMGIEALRREAFKAATRTAPHALGRGDHRLRSGVGRGHGGRNRLGHVSES